MLSEPIAVTLLVIEALEALNVPYLIGGSLASAVHGVARATADTDLVTDLRPEHAEPLAEALIGAFYVDTKAIQDAVRHRNSFNVIHLETMFKVDLFVRKQRPFDQAQFERRVAQAVSETLPNDSKEKKLLDGFLVGRERVREEVGKAAQQERLWEG